MKPDMINLTTKDGDSVEINLDILSKPQERINYLGNFMKGMFEVNGIGFDKIDEVQQKQLKDMWLDMRTTEIKKESGLSKTASVNPMDAVVSRFQSLNKMLG